MRIIKKSFLITISLLLCACSNNDSFVNHDQNFYVGVQETEHCKVTSTNPLELKKGDDATFELSFDKNYVFKSATAGNFSEGKLTVPNVQYPQTIQIECVRAFLVSIELYNNCHFSIVGDNEKMVEEGKNATFNVVFDDGYSFESTSDGVFENNTLLIENVTKDTKIIFNAKLKGHMHLQVETDDNLGIIKINDSPSVSFDGYVGDEVKIEAVPTQGKRFVCWSKNQPVSKIMPFSFERVLNLTLSDDTKLYANYWNNDENTIIYDGNGGSTSSNDSVIYYPHSKSNHIRINTIQGSNAFHRDGYVLESWNTSPDGSGERIGLGSRFKINDSGQPPTLYAIWVKETPDEYFEFMLNGDSTYSVVNCTSEADTIVVPEKHIGHDVVKISPNAFSSLPFSKLVLPPTLKTIEAESVVNCDNFVSLHFFDALDSIPNNFYVGRKPSFIYINANTDPCYGGLYTSTFAYKVDLLLERNSKKIICIGNSNTLYSIDGSTLSKHFGIDVLSFGVEKVAAGVGWELACLNKYCHDDENIVVFCHEFDDAINDGANTFRPKKYYAAECNYDLLTAIDFNKLNYSNVFEAYTLYKIDKNNAVPSSYNVSDYSCDAYGCLKLTKEPYRSDDWAPYTIPVDLDFYANGGFDWIKEYCDDFTNSTFYVSCCSYNKNCISQSKREAFYSSYQQSIIENTGMPVISKLSDYAFSGTAFLDDNFHLIHSYAVERTNQLISDLSPYIS